MQNYSYHINFTLVVCHSQELKYITARTNYLQKMAAKIIMTKRR